MDEAFYNQLKHHRLIPVIKLESLALAAPLARALAEGGLPIAEVTLRTECALDCITAIAAVGNVSVGAGTVLNREQCLAANKAGATFIVSPGLHESVVECCRELNVPCIPGVATATELQRAYNLGIRIVKFFPAEANGGVAALKALAGPFHEMEFVPTGGINVDNLQEYLGLPQTVAVGGSWMVKPALYTDGDFSSVAEAVQNAVRVANSIS